ncbi:hypothetical protein TVAG_109460 [Trichomonas vaginalis G3]|uniref:DnaK protein n=1 Tax=Trichomonas vaginalis (strain ATCC PRA-98 / G3) TaxID=412133 RepID=A2EAD5_TRIV3|nr:Actin, Chain A, domain 4 family [Trichomonas vaginalis G3]EAY10362.1 hypothetical protein TVAG_109460 [Trichomonas vaginalis G3]KAI5485355.1 Actin, Chain A, domain 4 family [Trichomonas vaginalis G3]|eukprot:XP_001322585.1 hypothetical protein [Trichomonas vaginalis G3]
MSKSDTGVLVIVLGNEYTTASFVTKDSAKNVTDGPYSDFKTIISNHDNRFYYSNFASNVSLAHEKETYRNFFLNLINDVKYNCNGTEFNSFQLFCKFLNYVYEKALNITSKESINKIFIFFPYWASDEFRKNIKAAACFKLDYPQEDVLLGTFPYPMRAFLGYQKMDIKPEDKVLIVDFGASNTEFFIMDFKDKNTVYLHDFYILNFGGNDVTNIVANHLLNDDKIKDYKNEILKDERLKRAFWEGANKTKENLIPNTTVPFNPVAITHIDVQTTIKQTDITDKAPYKVPIFITEAVNSLRFDLKPTKFVFIGLASNLKFFADDIRNKIQEKYKDIKEISVNSTKDFKLESCIYFVQQFLGEEIKRRRKFKLGQHMNIYDKDLNQSFAKPVKFNKKMAVALDFQQISINIKIDDKADKFTKLVDQTKESTPQYDIDKLQDEASGVIIKFNDLLKQSDEKPYSPYDEEKCESEDPNELIYLINEIRSKADEIAKSNQKAKELLNTKRFEILKIQ